MPGGRSVRHRGRVGTAGPPAVKRPCIHIIQACCRRGSRQQEHELHGFRREGGDNNACLQAWRSRAQHVAWLGSTLGAGPLR